jgi:AsmA-like C-terminal region
LPSAESYGRVPLQTTSETKLRHIGRIAFIASVVCLALLLVLIGIALHYSDPILHARAIEMLQEKFQSEVELKQFHVYVFPKLRVEGSGLELRHLARTDVPPLISIGDFSAEMNVSTLWKKPWKINRIKLNRLVIQIPPKGNAERRPWSFKHEIAILVGELVADDSQLVLLPKSTGKAPHEFDIHHLVMRQVGLHRAASFQAQLTNATPPGEIDTAGIFGPWVPDNPGQTPLGAQYKFRHADLGVFKGIGGILSSEGRFGGVLEEIEVEGKTWTPDFRVTIGGHPVSLDTVFSATVDGTNGNTILHPVQAHFLDTDIIAKGGVFKIPGAIGHTIALNVVVKDGRLEDLMRLALKAGRGPLTGAVNLHTKFDLPPSDQDISHRLKLRGAFDVGGAEFTNPQVSSKIENFSRRSLGKPEDPNAGSDVSALGGNFVLDNGVITFRGLKFSVTGADVNLNGSYGLNKEKLDFYGTLRMQARLSQTTTGFKSFLLKAVDPFFRKNGKTVLPIKISGTREHPQFGLDLHHQQDQQKTPANDSN